MAAMTDDETNLDMILGTISEAPAACAKFMNFTPANPHQVHKRKPTSEPQSPTNKRTRTTSTTGSTSGSVYRSTGLTNNAIDIDELDGSDSDEAEEKPVVKTAVVHPKIKTPAPPRRPNSRVAPPLLKAYPAFEITPITTYNEFLDLVCTRLGATREMLLPKHEEEMEYRYQKPKTSEPVPLGGAEGFRIMSKTLFGKKPDYHTIDVHLPPPTTVRAAPAPWSNDADKQPKFDPSAFDPTLTFDSIAAQRESINQQSKSQQQDLLDRYSIGNFPNLDPQKRYWHDVRTGYYYELTSLRIGVWANALAKGTAGVDLHTPPQSNHFNPNTRVKNIHGRNNEPPSAPAHALPTTAATAPVPAPDLSVHLQQMQLMQLMQMQMQMQMSGYGMQLPGQQLPFPQVPFMPSGRPSQPHFLPSRSLPPSPVKKHNVSVAQFCSFYDIDDADRDRLEGLGFRPGRVLPKELNQSLLDLGFVRFAWDHIIASNTRFKHDLTADAFGEGLMV